MEEAANSFLPRPSTSLASFAWRPTPEPTTSALTLDLGKGPLAQSILALAGSKSLIAVCGFLGVVGAAFFALWVEIIPKTLLAVEASPDALQSVKKSDDPPKYDLPFDYDEKVQATIQEVTATQPDGAPKRKAITSSLRRTYHYWLKMRGKLGAVTYCSGFALTYVFFLKIQDRVEQAVGEKVVTLAIYQSPPWYLSTHLIETVPELLIQLIGSLVEIPLALACNWHILTWQRLDRRPRTDWPPLQRLLTARGLWSLVKRMELPALPSKRAIRHMVIPALIQFAATELWLLYPDSLVHLVFVAAYGAEARPNVLVAISIIVERCLKFVMSHVSGWFAHLLVLRVEASMLPEEALPILPFDRTYGLHKTKHKEEPGITMTEAWSTLSWEALYRIVIMHVKMQVLFWVTVLPIGFALAVGELLMDAVQAHHDKQQMMHGEL